MFETRSQERMKVLDLLAEGKISAEEARDLLEEMEGADVVALALKREKKDESQVVGFGRWVHLFLFKFIPMLLGFGIAAGLLYGLFIHLPTTLEFEKLAIVYGVIGIVILAIPLAIYGIVRTAVKGGAKIRSSGGNIYVEEKEEKKI